MQTQSQGTQGSQGQVQSGDRQALEEIGRRHGFGSGAVEAMLDALRRGNGTMAQFNHPEFSGPGQWMRGGMTMVSNMFDNGLKSRVSALADDLSGWLANQPPSSGASQGGGTGGQGSSFSSSSGSSGSGGQWWPAEFSNPASSGSQNSQRYAYFPDRRRLVIDDNGEVSVYDTQDLHIGGVSQQQSGSGSMSFQSQRGPVNLGDLPLVSRSGGRR